MGKVNNLTKGKSRWWRENLDDLEILILIFIVTCINRVPTARCLSAMRSVLLSMSVCVCVCVGGVEMGSFITGRSPPPPPPASWTKTEAAKDWPVIKGNKAAGSWQPIHADCFLVLHNLHLKVTAWVDLKYLGTMQEIKIRISWFTFCQIVHTN